MNRTSCCCGWMIVGLVCAGVQTAYPAAPVSVAQSGSREGRDFFPVHDSKAANDCLQEGIRCFEKGQLVEARRRFLGCVIYWQNEVSRHPAQTGHTSTRLAEAVIRLSGVEMARGRHCHTLELCDVASDLLKNLRSRESKWLLAEASDGRAATLSALGRYDKAIPACEKAVKCWIHCGQDASEDRQWAKAKLRFYSSWLNLMGAYVAQGRDKFVYNRVEYRIETHLGNLVEDVEQLVKERFGQERPCLAAFYNAQADLLFRTGQLQDAQEVAKKALDMATRCGDLPGRLLAGHLLAQICCQRGDLEAAEREWISLLKSHEDCGAELWVGRTLRRLGDVSCKNKQWDRAIDYHRRAVEILDRSSALPVARFMAKSGLASAWCHGGEAADPESVKTAIALLEEAIVDIIWASAATTGGEIHLDEYLAHFDCAHELLLKLLLRQGSNLRALYWTEEFGRRLGTASLQVSGADLLRPATPELAEEFRSLLRERERLLAQTRHDTTQTNVYIQLRRLERRILLVWNKILDANSTLRSITGTVIPFEQFQTEFGNFQEVLKRDKVAVLDFSLRGERGQVCLITGDTVRHCALEVSPGHANTLSVSSGPFTRLAAGQVVGWYIDVISHPKKADGLTRGFVPARGPRIPTPTLNPSQLRERAQAVFEILLPKEVRGKLQQYDHIVIIPDGVLHRLPFQALVVGEDEKGPVYMLDRFPPMSYAPSIRALALLRARDGRQRPEKTNAMMTGGFYLEGASQGCTAVEKQFHDLFTATPLIGGSASETAFKRHAPQCALIYIGAHAVYSGELDNIFGYVLLADRESSDDGRLEIPEIYQLKLDGCQLVVLSACKTAVGSNRHLQTGNSLARAFLVAGATRVVASFWMVNDEATRDLMTGFCKQVANALRTNERVDYAAALHLAMRQLRSESRRRSPYYWAPFALYGPASSDGPGGLEVAAGR